MTQATHSTDPLVLLVEDEPQMRRFLRASLTSNQYRLLEATTGQEAIALLTSHNPKIVLLDLGLPDIDGITLTQQIREWSQVPIVVISARGREDDKVAALDAGADDYVTKPFGMPELLARLRVSLRHSQRIQQPQVTVLDVGGLQIDFVKRLVFVNGSEVHLTPTEYQILSVLAQHVDKVVTHQHILREVWGAHRSEQAHHVRVHMAEIRKKIEPIPAKPRWLLTEAGVGYRLRDVKPEHK